MANHRLPEDIARHALQPTALVNEVYLRLVNLQNVPWNNRAHFFALSARLMRRILVDLAQAKGYQKRGVGIRTTSLESGTTLPPTRCFGCRKADSQLVRTRDAKHAGNPPVRSAPSCHFLRAR